MASVFKRAGKNGRYSWYIRYRDPSGRDVKKKVPARTKREAEYYLAKTLKEIEDGEYEKKHRQSRTTLFEILDDFPEYSKAHKRSWKRDMNSIHHLKKFFGNVTLNMITPSGIEKYIAWRKDSIDGKGKHPAPATINRELACLKTAFNRAIRDGKAVENPVQKVKFLPENNVRDRVLNEEEFEKLLQVSPEHLKPILICAYETGMRLGEILPLRWEQVNLGNRIITLRSGETKTGEGRKVPISPRLYEVLSSLGRAGEYVFTYQGERVKSIRRSFKRARQRAGIRDFRFHDFRHTFVTRMRRKGVPDRVIMNITGHKTLVMLNRYDRIDEQDLLQAVSR